MNAVLKIMALVRGQGGSYSPKPIFTILAHARRKKKKRETGGLETMNRRNNVQESTLARGKNKVQRTRVLREGFFSPPRTHTTPLTSSVSHMVKQSERVS